MVDPRPSTETERDRLEPVLSETDIPVRVSATMAPIDAVRPNGKATGWWRDTRRIVLAEQGFDRLDDEQLRALLAHQIGHHRGRHPLILGVCKLVVFLLTGALGSLLSGLTLADLWSWAVYPVAIAVLVLDLLFGGSVVCWWVEFAADRRGATLLGSKAPLRSLLEFAVND